MKIQEFNTGVLAFALSVIAYIGYVAEVTAVHFELLPSTGLNYSLWLIGICLLVSVPFSILSIWKKKSPALGITALCMSIVGLLFFAAVLFFAIALSIAD